MGSIRVVKKELLPGVHVPILGTLRGLYLGMLGSKNPQERILLYR